ncbi:uncharacterized protein [Salminus brasiliensis]|uniref:uncharacterized protein n=1 Tax=Salminus brasiliensis TaxID=930266 RepID=UPI003B836544
MLSVDNMDLPSDCGQLLSDCQDVEALVQEEFQRQILEDSLTFGLAKTTGSKTDLWDSLWKPVGQSFHPAVNPVVIPVVNPIVKPVDNAVIRPVGNPAGKPVDSPPVGPVGNPIVNPVFCLACDTMFINRLTLEEHVCPYVNFICSCGISFKKYPEMWSHSTSHNHKATYVINHKSAIQSRINSVKEQEWKLKVLEETAKNVGIAQKGAPFTPVPHPPSTRYIAGKTVNLWKRFKPVVKLETFQRFCTKKKYMCVICREAMCSQDMLIEHVSAAHNTTCIYGCSRCGLLLIGRVPPKVLHRCGAIHTNPYGRFTHGQMLRDPLAAESLYMPYACQFCSLKFSHQVHLSNHVRFNHNNVSKAQEPPKTTALWSVIEGAQQPLESVPNGTLQTLNKVRCAVCGRRNISIEMLDQHWCTWTLTLLNSKTIARMVGGSTQQRSDSCPPSENSSTDVGVHSEDVNNVKTYGHAKLLTIKTEPVEVNVTMMQTDFSCRTSVKTEPELHDIDSGAGKAPAEINGLFYQKCSVPNANNLKYLFSSI